MGELKSIEGGRKAKTPPKCQWCGEEEEHYGFSCARLAAVDFFDDGFTISRVEFVVDEQDVEFDFGAEDDEPEEPDAEAPR